MVVNLATSSRRFRDQVVIVSGALGAVGFAAACRFAQEGARLVLADLMEKQSGDRRSLAIAECESLGSPETLAVDCDVTDEAQVNSAVNLALERFGSLDVLANVAGFGSFRSFEETTAAEWRQHINVNLMGPVFFSRRALQVMTPGSAIVNVSSIHAVRTTGLAAPYAASKAALLSLTRSIAIEGKPKGVRANAVLPGAVDTPMLWSNPNMSSGTGRNSLEALGEPRDVAAAIAFLASSDAAFITGSTVCVDGGQLASS